MAHLSFTVSWTLASVFAGYCLGRMFRTDTLQPTKNHKTYAKQVIEQAKAKAGFLGSTKKDTPDASDSSDEDEGVEVNSLALNTIAGEVRMALVVRSDLQMTKGKVAAQCCHAALACYRLIAEEPSRDSYNPHMVSRWLSRGQAKITLKCPDKESMDELFANALALGINCYVVHDAGRTQIEAGSATVLGLGPAPKAILDEVTGGLKLY
ncbi:aminoacyl-tRNA hydrolase Ecym_4699 [Eremothecium cymbalariae DBVPG|uniref:peptidyl-tRNA hydrolase n=1 Tax=Eremothecium cymbalariae (strain CBS 270.75 / DBVPG 7215 / KCTC 17166 / NRRL Y-17582) TaxID=931890 RepID=G8JSJ7_ERECY|nr:hypothetical protein Ecym_4699 [Eremothecium cymbalariae DBVPG\